MAAENPRRILDCMGKLESVIAGLKKLPDKEQDRWAELIRVELELDRISKRAGPRTELDRLAEEAMAEHEAGRTVLFDEAELARMTASALAGKARKPRKVPKRKPGRRVAR